MRFQPIQVALLIPLAVFCLATPPVFGAIVISEVMANALDEDTGEFIELFNPDSHPIDVLDWRFTDGDATDIIQPFRDSQTAIPPNSYGLILDSEYADEYDLPSDTILLTTRNTTLGDGLQTNDPLTLFDESGIQIIDTYSHPFNPKNGFSVERVDIDAGDILENWKASIDASGSTPGRENSVATTIIGPPPDDKPDTNGEKPPQPTTPIFINEIMHSPDTKADQTEWIELFNPNPQWVDLGKWRVEDASGKSGAIPEETQITGNGFQILAKNQLDFRAQYIDQVDVVEIDLPALNNSGDTIILYDSTGRQIDLVRYVGTGSVRGRSVERIAFVPSDQVQNWKLSIDLAGATPGRANSRSQQIAGKLKLAIAPTPFNPQERPTSLQYEAPTDALVTLQIFDSAGRLVRVLLDRREAGGKQKIAWDGRDEDGNRIPTGVYICQLIASGELKEPAMQIAKTVVVAERLK